jgi:carboxypeptidase C (cathepsin A)
VASTKDKPSGTSDAASDIASNAPYRAPRGVERAMPWPGGGGGAPKRLQAAADWIVLREHGVPVAEVFHVSYVKESKGAKRPITFLFNGGPGAASAFLHLGTAGPRRIAFGTTGEPLAPPVRMVDNAESWLAFSDLVFVDPVGTGFSRTVSESRLEQSGIDSDDEKRAKRTKELPDAQKGFFKIKRDIDVLCEFVSAYLSRHKRWDSPVAIVGESYGGFRVGKLMRALPERGIGLCSAVMVSPAIDFLGLVGSDYDLLAWANAIPSMAVTARHHGKARGRFAQMSATAIRDAAETFVDGDLSLLFLRGDRAPAKDRSRTLATMADLIGLSEATVTRCGGRVPIDVFGRELLQAEGLLCGLYDASVTGPNVFPDREGQPNPDPTLSGITTAFTAGINTMLRSELGLTTEREYLLISEDAWRHWADDRAAGYWQRQLECADDMRYGLALNPELRLLITHGWYDLVTTYYSSERTVASLRLPPALRSRVELRNYDGGHMFYTWESSRKAVKRDVERALSGQQSVLFRQRTTEAQRAQR